MVRKLVLLVFSLLGSVALAQSPVMTKVDPPNWWAKMPKAMLLVQGEHLDGAAFKVSDKKLRVERTIVSANGHWAQVWLSGSPEKAETVDVIAERAGQSARMQYRFAERKAASDGFAGFSSKDVMYLIMTDRFADGDASNDWQAGDASDEKTKIRGWHGGDLRGVMQHLDYLQEMGVTTVWITPVYQNHEAQSYHGYGATDMYAVDEHYGTLADLKTLSAAVHQRGMKLVLDTVPNHIGPKHPWVEDEPADDWFHGTAAKHHTAQGDFAPLTNPHAAWRDKRDVTEGWFANLLPDMNQESPAVAQYLTQNAVWWVEEAGLDGLRLDTFPYVGRAFWQGFHGTLHSLYPRLTTVGEVFNPDATITSSFAGGVVRNGVDTGLDTPFDFPSYFALREVFLKDAPMTKLAEVLRQDSLFPHPERLVPFLGNHDTTRFLGEPGATVERLRLAFVVLTTMRGMPQIYSGDEIAMRGGDDPDNRRDFPGGFGGAGAFTAAGRTPEQAAMFDWVKGLLKMRATRTELSSGEEQVLEAKGGVLVYVRGAKLGEGCSAGSRVMVVVNNGVAAESVTVPVANTSLEGCAVGEVLWGKGDGATMQGGVLHLDLAGRQAAVIGVR
ncbi:MAG: Cyclomaltodextrinase [Acidobacteriaceae bacterium]|nr:Cyclomaltodextrinase [Acidobacteriaceae bacterium]